MIRIGAYFDGSNMWWVAIKERQGKRQLIGREAIEAPTLEYAVAALGVLNRNYKVKKPAVTLTLASHLVWSSIQQFSIPADDEREIKRLAEAVNLAASKEIPKNLDTTNLTYQAYPNVDGQRVIFATCDQRMIDQISAQLPRLSYASFAVEFSFVSLSRRWLIDKPSVVLHLQQGELQLALFDPLPLFLYTTSFVVKDTKKFSQSEIDAINGELRRAVTFYRQAPNRPKLEAVYLSGFGASKLSKKLDISVPVSPALLVKPENYGLGEEYAVSLGAIERESGLDFLGPVSNAKEKSRTKLYFLIFGIATLLAAGVIAALVGYLSR